MMGFFGVAMMDTSSRGVLGVGAVVPSLGKTAEGGARSKTDSCARDAAEVRSGSVLCDGRPRIGFGEVSSQILAPTNGAVIC